MLRLGSIKGALSGLVAIAVVGCTAPFDPPESGFLSDYSQLKPAGNQSLRFLAPDNLLGEYRRFIIDPVKIYYHEGGEAKEVTDADMSRLAVYMRSAVVDAIADEYDIVMTPGPGIARVRMALTNVQGSSTALNVLPVASTTGVGLGAASMEGEVVDSKTGVQIAAMIESTAANRISLDNWTEWGGAQGIMDNWAKRFRKRLDETHGN